MKWIIGRRHAAFATLSLLALGLSACSNANMPAKPPAAAQGDMYLPPSGPGQTERAYNQPDSAANNGGMLLPPPGPGHVEQPYSDSGNASNGGMLLPPSGPGTTEPAAGAASSNTSSSQ